MLRNEGVRYLLSVANKPFRFRNSPPKIDADQQLPWS
jgi:hypothetical protein